MKSTTVHTSLPAHVSPVTLNPERVLVRGIHLELTEALRAAATEKAGRLLRHNDHIVRVRVDLEHDHTKGDRRAFLAKGHIEIAGPDLIATVASEDAYKSIDLLVDKLDRMLRERSRHRADRRNNGSADGKFRPELSAED
jgi:putative sigma-54 modulation protein